MTPPSQELRPNLSRERGGSPPTNGKAVASAASCAPVACGTEAGSPKPASLPALEAIIERGRSAMAEVGEALVEIQERKLYLKAGYSTFAAYCETRWGFKRNRAYQLIDFALIKRDLPIENESQARQVSVAWRSNRDEVKRTFDSLAKASTKEQAVKEIVRIKGNPNRIVSPEFPFSRRPKLGPDTVVVVLGLPFGEESPEIRVIANYDDAIEMRDEMETSQRWRKVLLCPRPVENRAATR